MFFQWFSNNMETYISKDFCYKFDGFVATLCTCCWVCCYNVLLQKIIGNSVETWFDGKCIKNSEFCSTFFFLATYIKSVFFFSISRMLSRSINYRGSDFFFGWPFHIKKRSGYENIYHGRKISIYSIWSAWTHFAVVNLSLVFQFIKHSENNFNQTYIKISF